MSEKSLAYTLIEEAIATQSKFLDLGNCGLTDDSPELEILRECTFLEGLSLGRYYFEDDSKEAIEPRKEGVKNTFTKIPVSLPKKLNELSIYDSKIINLNNVEVYPQLKNLRLGRNKISKIENLDSLRLLEQLSLSNNMIFRIENIDSLKSLKRLILIDNKISKIENLDTLSNIVELDLSDNQISKIENLDTLTQLNSLDLSDNQISKIENLDSLTQLNSLDLSYNEITKIENLDTLTQLNSLDLNSNQITKIEKLNSLSQLNSLLLSYNEITKIEKLDYLTQLNSLDLSTNQISKIEKLDTLTQLNELLLSSNQITKIENLDSLSQLNSLDLYSNQISKIENLDTLNQLNSLDLNSNQITKIENLDTLTQLNELSLVSNQIVKLENLDKLIQLHKLYLNDNKIEKIENLDSLSNLVELYLSYNQIVKLENLDKLIQLHKLYLNDNKIEKIENLDSLSNLVELYLSDNQIVKLDNLDKPIQLNIIDLNDNKIEKIENLDTLTNLTELYLSYNEITKIENLNTLTNLKKLNLIRTQISKIENLSALHNLTKLNLGKNQITRIENLDTLTNLAELGLNSNHITKIENLDTLTQLNQINLSDNQIAKIENLNTLTQLNQINLERNLIVKLENLDMLTQLNILYLYENKIKKIENIDALINLYQFSIGYNQVGLIENIDSLKHLTTLYLEGNPIRNLPQSLVTEKSCLDYYKDWKKELEKTAPELYLNKKGKLILLGNGNVGKSTFLDALKYGKCTENKDSTHAVQLQPWDNKSIDYTFQVWDFGGQELFFGTHKLFMQGQSIIVILFDPETENLALVPDRERPQDLTRNKKIKQWIDIAKNESTQSPIIVIQTKKNKYPEKSKDIERYCTELDIEFIHLDSLTGQNIDEAVFYINKLSKERLYEYQMQMPRSWDNLRKYFLNLQEKEKPDTFYFKLSDFKDLCVQYGIDSYAHDSALAYLFNAGIIYKNETYLNDVIIYDIRWVLEAIYLPFKRNSSFFNILKDYSQGFIKYKDLKQEWAADYKEDHFPMFLSFMQSCSICFVLNKDTNERNIQEDDFLVFPEFLSIQKPEYIEKLLDKELTTLEIQFEYLPTYVIQNFISKFGNYTLKQNYWYNGILIDNQEFLYIESDLEQHMLTLKFKPNASKDWINEIKSQLPRHLIIDEKELMKFSEIKTDFNEEKESKENKLQKIDLTPVFNNPPLKVAISYAAEDFEECKILYDNLSILEADNKIRLFYDKNIDENDWDKQIREEFKDCDLIIVLNSADYNKPAKTYIWSVEIPIIQDKLSLVNHLNVVRINLSQCNSRDLILTINDHKMGVVPVSKYEKQAFYKKITDEIIIEKILNNPSAEKGH